MVPLNPSTRLPKNEVGEQGALIWALDWTEPMKLHRNAGGELGKQTAFLRKARGKDEDAGGRLIERPSQPRSPVQVFQPAREPQATKRGCRMHRSEAGLLDTLIWRSGRLSRQCRDLNISCCYKCNIFDGIGEGCERWTSYIPQVSA